jgi:hypothetical protein
MNVEIGAEAALFPEKEYIYGIAVAVQFIDKWTQRMGALPQETPHKLLPEEDGE